MSSQLARVTGVVLSTPEPRRGHSKVTGEAYEIATVNVLVAQQNVTSCQLPRKDDFNEYPSLSAKTGYRAGDLIDVLVDISTYQNAPQLRILSDFPLTANTPDFLAELVDSASK